MDKFSRIFLFGKIDFNPEKIFSGIWIIPIFGFTFVAGRRAVNAPRSPPLGQFGEIGSQNRIVHIVDRSVLGFRVYAPGKKNQSKN